MPPRTCGTNIEERIQARPYKAVLIAAGIGLVLGLVLRRR